MKPRGWRTARLSQIHFDMKRPCADCPFRRAVPKHEGIAANLVSMVTAARAGTLAHTCHKTDPRADGGKRRGQTGKLQHCAGAILMAKKSGLIVQRVLVLAHEQGRFEERAYRDPNNEVFTLKQMLAAYVRWLRRRKKAGTA